MSFLDMLNKALSEKDDKEIINKLHDISIPIATMQSEDKKSQLQSELYNAVLQLSIEKFNTLFSNTAYRNKLMQCLPNHTPWQIENYYYRQHATTDTRVKMLHYETDTGGLYRIQYQDQEDKTRTIDLYRDYSLGSERVLTAGKMSVSADDWKMMVDHGHGLYATSIVTCVITTLGIYINEVERAYNLQPIKDQVSGAYVLSEKDMETLKKRDPNAYAKYTVIHAAQQQLRLMYEKERFNPTPGLIEAFKGDMHAILAALRSALYQQDQGAIDHMPETSDHICAYAEKQINDFQWPKDNQAGRIQITERDQLLVTPGERLVYDPTQEPASAAGASVFGVPGLGKMGRDNLVHCLLTMHGVDHIQRHAVLVAAQKVEPSTGLRIEGREKLKPTLTSQEERAREMQSKRIALSILEKASENNQTVGFKLDEVFKDTMKFFDTYDGRKICEKEFGCQFEEFKAYVLYEMMVHASNETDKKDAKWTLFGRTDELFLSSIKDEKLQSKKDSLYQKALEKRDKRAKELKKIETLVGNFKDKITRLDDVGVVDRVLDIQKVQRNVSLYGFRAVNQIRDDHATVIAAYGSNARSVDEFRERINRFLDQYSKDFCVEVLGINKSDFIELVMRKALSRVPEAEVSALESHYKKSGWFSDLFKEEKEKREAAKTEKTQKTESATSIMSHGIISRKPNPLLEENAQKIAEQAIQQNDPIGFIRTEATKEMPHEASRLSASALYRYAFQCNDEQFKKIEKQLPLLITPFYNTGDIKDMRQFISDAKVAKADYEKAYQDARKTAYKKVENLPKDASAETIKDAIEVAEKEILAKVKAAQDKLDHAMQQINPRSLHTDHKMGDEFLRGSVTGFVKQLINPITGIFEEIGALDPIRGTVALGVMGLGMAYVAVAHGAAVAVASAHSKFVAALSKTYMVPEVYMNAMVLTPGASGLKAASAALVDGLTLGKTFYLLSSASDMAVSGTTSGFTGRVLAGIMNNPMETMVLTTLVAVAGEGIMHLLHEEADAGPGGWRVMLGFFEALKAADVGYHAVLESMKLVSREITTDAPAQKIQYMKTLYVEMLALKLFSGMTDKEKVTFPLDILREKYEKAFSEIDITKPTEFNKVDEIFLKQFNKTDQKTLELKMISKESALSTAEGKQKTFINEIKKRFFITETHTLETLSKAEQIHYGLCAQEGLKLLALNANLKPENIADAVLKQFPAMQPSVETVLENTNNGLALASLSLAEIEELKKWDVLSINSKLPKESAEDVMRSTVRSAELLQLETVLSKIRKSSEDPRKLSLEPKEVRLLKKHLNQFDKNALGEKLLIQEDFYRDLKAIIAPTMREPGNKFFYQLGKQLENFTSIHEREIRDDKFTMSLQDQIVEMLKPLFRDEVKRLEASSDYQNKSDTEKKNMMVTTLQQLCYEKMKSCSADEFKVLKQHPSLVQMIAGKPIDFTVQSKKVLESLSPSATANLEGAGKLFNLLARLPAKIVGVVGTAGIRAVTFFAGVVGKANLTRGEERFQRAGHAIARTVSGAVADATIARPDDVLSWRNDDVMTRSKEMTETADRVCEAIFNTAYATRREVLGKDPVPSYRLLDVKLSEEFSVPVLPQQSTVNAMDLKSALKRVCEQYTEKKGLGFDSHLIKSLRVALTTMPENADGKTAALHVLSALFPVESQQINQKMMQKGVSANDREFVKLHLLQTIMQNELHAASTKSKTAFTAYSNVLDVNECKNLRELLTGRSETLAGERHPLPIVLVDAHLPQQPKPGTPSVDSTSVKPT